MSKAIRVCSALALIAGGFVLGRIDSSSWSRLHAQDEVTGPSEETTKKIQLANDALKAATESLKNESLYVSATKSINVFGVLTGGLNAVDDLESGRGVDPETFAALHADDATEDVKQHLGKDEDGRLTYKNKVVRIYPISRLKKAYGQRAIVTGEVKPSPKQP
ncbi:MAG TPA: hypothetical protein VFG20_05670 [Planctomycetaceae bacterium]|nr:hypothetical protein [Planctomycetaceae bacterium]